MFALDTNVLVRLVVRDDPDQLARVEALLEAAAAAGEPPVVTDVVLCEAVWVLRSVYRLSRDQLVGVVDTLLRATHLSFPTRAELRTALGAYATGRGDFADYVIRERALAAGCTAVVTFDRALHGEPGFAAPA